MEKAIIRTTITTYFDDHHDLRNNIIEMAMPLDIARQLMTAWEEGEFSQNKSIWACHLASNQTASAALLIDGVLCGGTSCMSCKNEAKEETYTRTGRAIISQPDITDEEARRQITTFYEIMHTWCELSQEECMHQARFRARMGIQEWTPTQIDEVAETFEW